MAEKFEQAVIIKKIKKGGEAAHGGSWKVAYADFVTAMMAVFLLLWLLNMTSAQKKAALSQYFQNHSIFEKGGGSAVGKRSDVPGQGVLDPAAMPTAISQQKSFTASDVAKKLKEKIQDKSKEFKDRVFVINDNGNLRIEITDADGSSFYAPGGTEINENGRALLNEIATLLVGVDNKIMIEGHTDSVTYKTGDKSNWDLSTLRATNARQVLEKAGVKSQQVQQVAGYADTRPFVRENPADAKNRRISIVIDYNANKGKSPPLPGHADNEAPWLIDKYQQQQKNY